MPPLRTYKSRLTPRLYIEVWEEALFQAPDQPPQQGCFLACLTPRDEVLALYIGLADRWVLVTGKRRDVFAANYGP